MLLNIIKSLKAKYNIRVVVFNRGMIEKKLEKLGIKYDYFPAPKSARRRYLLKSVPLYFNLIKYIKENKIDLVYASGYFTAKLCGPAAKAAAVPMIWHKHQIITRPDSYLGSQILKYSKYADKIICVSSASAASLEKTGVDRKKLVIVRNGMDIPHIKRIQAGRIRKKYGLAGNFIVGTVGYFRKNKGLEILIRAAAIIKEKQPYIKFLIVGAAEPGDEAYETELRNMAGGPDKNVFFAGRQEKFKYLPAFDVFALPSIDEPFALSVLEALAAGVPVIAFKSGGTPEIVKDGYNGYLAGEISAESLAERIIYAYKNRKKLAVLGKNAKKTISKEFTLEKQMRHIENIVREVMKKPY